MQFWLDKKEVRNIILYMVWYLARTNIHLIYIHICVHINYMHICRARPTILCMYFYPKMNAHIGTFKVYTILALYDLKIWIQNVITYNVLAREKMHAASTVRSWIKPQYFIMSMVVFESTLYIACSYVHLYMHICSV